MKKKAQNFFYDQLWQALAGETTEQSISDRRVKQIEGSTSRQQDGEKEKKIKRKERKSTVDPKPCAAHSLPYQKREETQQLSVVTVPTPASRTSSDKGAATEALLIPEAPHPATGTPLLDVSPIRSVRAVPTADESDAIFSLLSLSPAHTPNLQFSPALPQIASSPAFLSPRMLLPGASPRSNNGSSSGNGSGRKTAQNARLFESPLSTVCSCIPKCFE